MATIYGVDLDEISTDNLVRSEHILTLYGILSGDVEYSDPSHKIDFTGSFMVGSNNTLESSVNFGFAFGRDNIIGGENSVAIGRGAETYAENQMVLAGGFINQIGDSQRASTTRNLTTSAGDDKNVVLPTKNNTVANIKIRISASVDSSFSNTDVLAGEYDLVFINSRSDPDAADEVGKILYYNRDYSYGSLLNDDSNGFDVRYEVNNNDELIFRVIDNRSSGSDIYWTIHVDSVETYAGDDITQFGSYGYGYVFTDDSNTTVYGDPISGCFLPSTKIYLADGSKIKISDVNVGDNLVSTNLPNLPENTDDIFGWSANKNDLTSFNTETTSVTDLYYHFVDGYKVINDRLEVTLDQPIFVFDAQINQFVFVRVRDLEENKMYVLNENFELELIETIDFVDKNVEVITIDVEESDLFFTENMLVHNKN